MQHLITPVPDGFVRLVAAEPLHGDPDRVAALLASHPPWADLRTEPSGGTGLRRYAVDLRLRLGSESAAITTFRKAAFLDLGVPKRTVQGWELEIGWRASSAAPLFPVFAGWLAIGPEELSIEGLYAPPGGLAGRAADRMLLHVAAIGTGRWLLGEIERAAAV